MNNVEQQKLRRELKDAGASEAELASLADVATRLGTLKKAERPAAAPPQQRARKLRLFLVVGLPSALSLAIGVLLVTLSQGVLPGNPLYPVQKMSDSVAITMKPSYRGVVMMKRADQVKQLVNNHASADRVMATLADYQRQAVSYKSTTSNYAAFEYCKQSLEQAATAAPSSEKQAIDDTVQSLHNI